MNFVKTNPSLTKKRFLQKKVSLQFVNPNIEKSYIHYQNKKVMLRLRLGMALGAIVYPLFLIADWHLHREQFFSHAIVRGAIMPPLLLIACLCTFLKIFQDKYNHFAIAILVITSSGIFSFAFLNPDLATNYLSICISVVILFGSTFSILNFPQLTFINSFIIVLFQIISVFVAKTSTKLFVLDNTLLLSVGLIGLIASWSIEKYSRSAYVSRIQNIELNRGLEKKVKSRTRKIIAMQDAVMFGLVKLSENRDDSTGEHLSRIEVFTRIFTTIISKEPNFREYITPQYCDDIVKSSILHDIGKVGISDNILLKPGKLTKEEFDAMKEHTTIGANALVEIDSKLKEFHKSFLTLGILVARNHHEKWDGTGYPEKLSGYNIPLSARIVSLVDVYDALTSKRPYKEPYSHEEAIEIIRNGMGTQFDPALTEIFCRSHNEFKNAAESGKFNQSSS